MPTIESLVHLDRTQVPSDYVVMAVRFDDSLIHSRAAARQSAIQGMPLAQSERPHRLTTSPAAGSAFSHPSLSNSGTCDCSSAYPTHSSAISFQLSGTSRHRVALSGSRIDTHPTPNPAAVAASHSV